MNVRAVVLRELPFACAYLAIGIASGLLLPGPWSVLVTLALCGTSGTFRTRYLLRESRVLRQRFLDATRTGRVAVLPPSATFAPTTQEAAENLAMMFGHELPLCEPIEACPSCSSVAAHLLGEPETGGGRRLTTRICRSCGHTWRERLDV